MIKYITKNDKILPYIIIKTNNKNTYLKVKLNYIEVKVGKYTKVEYALKLLEEKFEYFYEAFNSSKYELLKENEIILEEKKYQIVLEYTNNKFSYNINGNKIIVSSKIKDLEKIKYNIYQNHLVEMILKIDEDINKVLLKNNIKKRKILLKYFKTRYGSYHKKDDLIKLNIILAKANINELFYVIMHEYAHTKVFNHSKNFYNLLEQLMPNYKKYDKSVKNISIYL